MGLTMRSIILTLQSIIFDDPKFGKKYFYFWKLEISIFGNYEFLFLEKKILTRVKC